MENSSISATRVYKQITPNAYGLIISEPEGLTKIMVPMPEVDNSFFAVAFGSTEEEVVPKAILAMNKVLYVIMTGGPDALSLLIETETKYDC